jgi:hypothetical protein
MNELIDLPKMSMLDITAQELLAEIVENELSEERQEGEITVTDLQHELQANGKKLGYKPAYDRMMNLVSEGKLSMRTSTRGRIYFKRV